MKWSIQIGLWRGWFDCSAGFSAHLSPSFLLKCSLHTVHFLCRDRNFPEPSLHKFGLSHLLANAQHQPVHNCAHLAFRAPARLSSPLPFHRRSASVCRDFIFCCGDIFYASTIGNILACRLSSLAPPRPHRLLISIANCSWINARWACQRGRHFKAISPSQTQWLKGRRGRFGLLASPPSSLAVRLHHFFCSVTVKEFFGKFISSSVSIQVSVSVFWIICIKTFINWSPWITNLCLKISDSCAHILLDLFPLNDSFVSTERLRSKLKVFECFVMVLKGFHAGFSVKRETFNTVAKMAELGFSVSLMFLLAMLRATHRPLFDCIYCFFPGEPQ